MLWFDLRVHGAEHFFYCFAYFRLGFGRVDFGFDVYGYFFHFCSTFSRVCLIFCLVVSIGPSFMIISSAIAITFPKPTLSSRVSLSWNVW